MISRPLTPPQFQYAQHIYPTLSNPAEAYEPNQLYAYGLLGPIEEPPTTPRFRGARRSGLPATNVTVDAVKQIVLGSHLAFTIAQFKGTPSLKADTGYGPMTFGNSYIQVVGLTPAGVDASTFVTYSLSTDPASEHYDDYTRLYSTKQWVKAAFTEAEVAADTKSTLELSQ